MATVTARSFDGSDDVVRVAAPAYFSGAYTHVFVGKRATTSNFHSIASIGGAGAGSPYWVSSLGNSDGQQVNHGGGAATESDIVPTTSTRLYIVTREGTGSTGDGIPRFHIFDGTTWTHSAANSSSTDDMANWVTGESDEEMRFGNWNSSFNWFEGDMVMHALHTSNGLSDGECEALAGGDRDDYVSAGFTHLWEFDQASTATDVTDYIGALDQISLTGTTVNAAFDLPGTLYVLAGGGAPSTDDCFVRVGGAWVAADMKARVGGAWV